MLPFLHISRTSRPGDCTSQVQSRPKRSGLGLAHLDDFRTAECLFPEQARPGARTPQANLVNKGQAWGRHALSALTSLNLSEQARPGACTSRGHSRSAQASPGACASQAHSRSAQASPGGSQHAPAPRSAAGGAGAARAEGCGGGIRAPAGAPQAAAGCGDSLLMGSLHAGARCLRHRLRELC